MAKKSARGKIFVVSGPSGSGKTTIVARLLKKAVFKGSLTRSVSYTTRPKRSGEKEGRDYFFISPARFQQALREKKILEWTKYLGYYYATPKELFARQLAQGKSVILCLDVKGALRVRAAYPGSTVTIFVLPPSLGVLGKRMRSRCSRTKKAEIQSRIRLAAKELLAANKYDYCLVNQNLDKAVRELKTIVLDKLTDTQEG